VREGLAAICVARDVGAFPIRTLTLDIGDRRPLGVGAGSLALLAFLPDVEIDDIVKRNSRWLQDFQRFLPDELSVLVARTRRDGYALNEGRIIPGMNAIGVPVFNTSGEPIASLSLAAIKDRMGPERIPELVQALHAEAKNLTELLDFHAIAA
jgi:DNA-binding IclR family transcriptional regulator